MVDDTNEESVPRLSRAAVTACALTAVITVCWFVVSWIVLDSPLVDALGEAFGGVLALLVMISIVGSMRKSR